MNYILTEQHGKKIAVILNGMSLPNSSPQNDYTLLILYLEFGDCKSLKTLKYCAQAD
jgi:hypothetical protein